MVPDTIDDDYIYHYLGSYQDSKDTALYPKRFQLKNYLQPGGIARKQKAKLYFYLELGGKRLESLCLGT